MKIRITQTPAFKKAQGRLPPDRAEAVGASLVKFMEEPSLPRLDFRPLKGRSGYFIINAKRGDRIILRRVDDDHYEAIDVGPHDNVFRRMNR